MKTNFSFEIQYIAASQSSQAQRDEVMASLGPSLQALLAEQDRAAIVTVSDSHRGEGNKLVELTTTLGDAPIAEILKAFSARHGVVVCAFE